MSNNLLGRAERQAAKNLRYLENLERKNMSDRQLTDAMGIAIGGNNQPRPHAQPQVQFNPVMHLFVPMFSQTIQTILAAPPQNRPGNVNTPNQIVEVAYEVTSHAFKKLGFEFVAPMGANIIGQPKVE